MAVTKLVSIFAIVSSATASPNLLLVYLDQWRFDWAGFDDPAVRAPNLASIASKGTRFTHAFTPTPLCSPARGALASGKEYDDSPVPDNQLDYPSDGSVPTYYEQLQKVGYHVMMAGKDHLTMKSGVGPNGSINAEVLGFDDWERMPDKYEVFNDDYKPVPGTPYDEWSENLWQHEAYNSTGACYGAFGSGNCCDQIQGVHGLEGGIFCPRPQPGGKAEVVYPDDWTEASAERLLDRRPAERSWFMQIGFPGPHPPFILTEAMNKSVAGRTYPLPQGSKGSLGEDFDQVIRRAYAAEIENIDSLLGRLVAKLEASGDLGNTVIAVAADHGEMLGDYNKFSKSMPWDGSARVPMIFMGPGIKAGLEVTQPATTLDIVGTFLELAGAEKAENMTTQSMLPLLSNGTGGRTYVRSGLAGRGPGGTVDWRMVVKQMNATSTMKLVCCPTGCDNINGNSTLFPTSSNAQLGLFEIGGARLEVDLLSRGIGKLEATELINLLPPAYKKTCWSALAFQGDNVLAV